LHSWRCLYQLAAQGDAALGGGHGGDQVATGRLPVGQAVERHGQAGLERLRITPGKLGIGVH